MVIRMLQTRAIFSSLESPTILEDGKEYDLPKRVAELLVLNNSATFIPGRLRKFAPGAIQFPTERVDFNQFLKNVMVKK